MISSNVYENESIFPVGWWHPTTITSLVNVKHPQRNKISPIVTEAIKFHFDSDQGRNYHEFQ